MFDKAYNQVKQLVEDFKASESHYLSPNYSEAEVRKDFIDKFFSILGWDVDHHHQKNPFQQEVKVEKAQRQEGHQSQKRADYAFALAPDYKRTQFFVEAKKPSRLLRQNKDDYFQTAKYGWNSQTGISILTDFQELVIIDCRFKPDFDTILKNEIKYYSYEEFAQEDKFAEIYWLFSREALLAGNLAEFIDHLPKPKAKEKQLKLFGGKYQSIDESFLNYIDDIRLQMAQAFHYNNPSLDHYDLTEATQRTIDRLVFIRFLEDKQIEPEDLMHSISTANYPWQKLIEISKRLDAKYNGVVFKEHFIDKKEFLGADEELFRKIAADLDHTNTPYDFNYIPIHILGNIYERFLGKIIVVENGKATIELKPEVRKAGGVFYTPKYIVDYIVENTVGKLIANKKPKEIAKLTFADIACGSGSFLIGVFDYLLDYHKNYYNQNPEEAKKDGCKYDTENQVWVLTIKQKQNILTNNVYGVDIDLQATEVTQVSLFLKLLEDETMGTVAELNQLFVADKILPDLSNNIKCGNSLIGTEIMDDVLDFGRDEMRKLNPFDFETAFPKVFSPSLRGTKQSVGFDAIVGNPPYLSTKGIEKFHKEIFIKNFQYSNKGQFDLYGLFIEKALKLINSKGKLGYITSNTFLSNKDFLEFRKYLIKNTNIEEIINLGETVFIDASLDVSIVIISKTIESNNEIFIIKDKNDFDSNISKKISQNLFNNENDFYELTINLNENEFKLFSKFFKNEKKLSDFLNLPRGIEIGGNSDKIQKKYIEDFEKLLVGKNIKKYLINFNDFYIEFENDKSVFKDIEIYKSPKILIQRIRNLTLKDRIISTIDYDGLLCTNTLRIGILKENSPLKLEFFLSLLNSKLINYLFLKKFINKDIYAYQLERIPIPKITPENQQLHDDLVKLVEQMLKAKKEEQTAKTDHEKNLYKNLTESLDFKINNLVYQLYNLTPEEIQLVENS